MGLCAAAALCGVALLAGAGAVAAKPLSLSILSWNVHWQCGSDHLPGCREAATQKFVELSKTHAADVIVAVELEHNDTAPIDLPSHLDASRGPWTQVNGSCPGAPGKTGDALALVLGPGWEVQAATQGGTLLADGGCLGGDAGGVYKADARAFAVALVKPSPFLWPGVDGCEMGICLIGLHAPHVDITEGAAKVAAVCGEARHQCTVAVGDWNAPFGKKFFCKYTVADRWLQLIGSPAAGSAQAGARKPTLAAAPAKTPAASRKASILAGTTTR